MPPFRGGRGRLLERLRPGRRGSTTQGQAPGTGQAPPSTGSGGQPAPSAPSTPAPTSSGGSQGPRPGRGPSLGNVSSVNQQLQAQGGGQRRGGLRQFLANRFPNRFGGGGGGPSTTGGPDRPQESIGQGPQGDPENIVGQGGSVLQRRREDRLANQEREELLASESLSEEDFRRLRELQGFSSDIIDAEVNERFGQQFQLNNPFGGGQVNFRLGADDQRLSGGLRGITPEGQIDERRGVFQISNPQNLNEFLFNVNQQSPETQAKLREAASLVGGPQALFDAVQDSGSIAFFLQDNFGPSPDFGGQFDLGFEEGGVPFDMGALLDTLGVGGGGGAEPGTTPFEPPPLQAQSPSGDPGFATASAPVSSVGAGGNGNILQLLLGLLGQGGGGGGGGAFGT